MAHPAATPSPLRRTDAPTWALAGIGLTLALAGCGTALPGWRVEQVLAVRDALPAQGSVAAALAEAHRHTAGHEPGLAAALFREAARRAPDDGHVLHQTGVGLAQLGQHAEALDLLSRADRLQPGQAALLNNLGYAWMLSGQPEAARAPLLAALRAQPGHVQARINLDALPPVHTASGRVMAPGNSDTAAAAPRPDAMQFRAALPPGEVPALFAGPRGGTVVMAEWATPAVRADAQDRAIDSAGDARFTSVADAGPAARLTPSQAAPPASAAGSRTGGPR